MAGRGGAGACLTKYIDVELLERCAGTKALTAVTELRLGVLSVPGRRRDDGDVPEQRIRRIENLEPVPNLTHLAIEHQSITKIENLGCLKALTHLNLRDNAIERLEAIPPRITQLDVSKNAVDAIPVSIGRGCGVLRELHAADNRIEALSKIQGLRHMRNLEVLDLRRNPVCAVEHYRSYVIWAVPSVAVLDGDDVTEDERARAEQRWQQEEMLRKDTELRGIQSRLTEQDEQVHQLERAGEERETVLRAKNEKIRGLTVELRASEAERAKVEKLAEERREDINRILFDLITTKDALGRLLIALDFDEINAEFLLNDVLTDEVREVMSRTTTEKLSTAHSLHAGAGGGTATTQHAQQMQRIQALEAAVVDTQKLKTKYERWKVDHAHTLLQAEERAAALEAQLSAATTQVGGGTDSAGTGTATPQRTATLVAELRSENVELRQQVRELESSMSAVGTPLVAEPIPARTAPPLPPQACESEATDGSAAHDEADADASVAHDAALAALREELEYKTRVIASLQQAVDEFERAGGAAAAVADTAAAVVAVPASGGDDTAATLATLRQENNALRLELDACQRRSGGGGSDPHASVPSPNSPSSPMSGIPRVTSFGGCTETASRVTTSESPKRVLSRVLQADTEACGIHNKVEALEDQLAMLLGASQQKKGVLLVDVDRLEGHIATLRKRLDVMGAQVDSKDNAIASLVEIRSELLAEIERLVLVARGLRAKVNSLEALVGALRQKLSEAANAQRRSSRSRSRSPSTAAAVEDATTSPLSHAQFADVAELVGGLQAQLSGPDDAGGAAQAQTVEEEEEAKRLRGLLTEARNEGRLLRERYELLVSAFGSVGIDAGDVHDEGALPDGFLEQLRSAVSLRTELATAHERVAWLESLLTVLSVPHSAGRDAARQCVDDINVRVAAAAGSDAEASTRLAALEVRVAVLLESLRGLGIDTGAAADVAAQAEALQREHAQRAARIETLEAAEAAHAGELATLRGTLAAAAADDTTRVEEIAALRGEVEKYEDLWRAAEAKEAEHATMRAALQVKAAEVESLEVAQEALRRGCQTREAAAESARTRAEREVEDAHTCIAALEAQVATLTHDAAQKDEEMRVMNAELLQCEQEKGEHIAACQSLMDAERARDDAIAQEEAERGAKEDLQVVVAGLKKELADALAGRGDVVALTDRNSELQAVVDTQTQKLNALQAELQVLGGQEAELRDHSARLVTRLQAAEDMRAAAEQTRDELLSTTLASQGQAADVEALTEEVDALRAQVDATAADKQQLEEKVARLTGTLDAQEERMVALEADAHTARDALRAAEVARDTFAQRCEEAATALAQAAATADAANTELRADLERARRAAGDLQREHATLEAEAVQCKDTVATLRDDVAVRDRDIQTLTEQNTLLRQDVPGEAHLAQVAALQAEVQRWREAAAANDEVAAALQKEKGDHIATHQRLREAEEKLAILEAAVASVASSPLRAGSAARGVSASPALSATQPCLVDAGAKVEAHDMGAAQTTSVHALRTLQTELDETYRTVFEQEEQLSTTRKELTVLQGSVQRIQSELEQALFSAAAGGSPVVVPPEFDAEGVRVEDPVSCVMSLVKKVRQHLGDSERGGGGGCSPSASGGREVVTRRLLYPQTPEEMERAERDLATSPASRAAMIAETQELLRKIRVQDDALRREREARAEVEAELAACRGTGGGASVTLRDLEDLQRALDAKDEEIAALVAENATLHKQTAHGEDAAALRAECANLQRQLEDECGEAAELRGRNAQLVEDARRRDAAEAAEERRGRGEADELREELRVVSGEHAAAAQQAADWKAIAEAAEAAQSAARTANSDAATAAAARERDLEETIAALRNEMARLRDDIATLQHVNALLESSPDRTHGGTPAGVHTRPAAHDDDITALRRENVAMRDERDRLEHEVASLQAVTRTLKRSLDGRAEEVAGLKDRNSLLERAADAGAAHGDAGRDTAERPEESLRVLRAQLAAAEAETAAKATEVVSLEKAVQRLEATAAAQDVRLAEMQGERAGQREEMERLRSAQRATADSAAELEREVASLRAVNTALASGAGKEDRRTPRSTTTLMTTPTLPTPPEGPESRRGRLDFGSPTPPQALSRSTRGSAAQPPVAPRGGSVSPPQGTRATPAAVRRLEDEVASLTAELQRVRSDRDVLRERHTQLVAAQVSKDEEISALRQVNHDMLDASAASLPLVQAGAQDDHMPTHQRMVRLERETAELCERNAELQAEVARAAVDKEKHRADAVCAAAVAEEKVRLELQLEEAQHHAAAQARDLRAARDAEAALEDKVRALELTLRERAAEEEVLRDDLRDAQRARDRLEQEHAEERVAVAAAKSSETALQARLRDADNESLELTRQMLRLQEQVAAAAAKDAEVESLRARVEAQEAEHTRYTERTGRLIERLEGQVASFIAREEAQNSTIDALRGEVAEERSRHQRDVAELDSHVSLLRGRQVTQLSVISDAATAADAGAPAEHALAVLRAELAEAVAQKEDAEVQVRRLQREQAAAERDGRGSLQSPPRHGTHPPPPMISPLELATVQHTLETERLKNRRLADELAALKASLGAMRGQSDQKIEQLRRVVEQSSAAERSEVGRLVDMVGELLAQQHAASPARQRGESPTPAALRRQDLNLGEQQQQQVKVELDVARMRSEVSVLTAALQDAKAEHAQAREKLARLQAAEADADKLHQDIAAKDYELAAAAAETTQLKKQVASLADAQRARRAAEAQVEEANAQLAVAQRKAAGLAEEVAAQKARAADVHKRQQEALDACAREEATLHERVRELTREMVVRDTQVAEGERAVAQLKEDLADVQARLESAAAAAGATLTLRAEATAQQRAMDDAERTIRELREEVATFEERSLRAAAKVRELEDRAAHHEGRFAVTLHKATQTDGSDTAGAARSAGAARVRELEGVVEDLERTVAELEAENAALRAAVRGQPPPRARGGNAERVRVPPSGGRGSPALPEALEAENAALRAALRARQPQGDVGAAVDVAEERVRARPPSALSGATPTPGSRGSPVFVEFELDAIRQQMQGLQRNVDALHRSRSSTHTAGTASPRKSASPVARRDPQARASPGRAHEFSRTLPQTTVDASVARDMLRLDSIADFERSQVVRSQAAGHHHHRSPGRAIAVDTHCRRPRSPEGDQPYLYDVDHTAGFRGVRGARHKGAPAIAGGYSEPPAAIAHAPPQAARRVASRTGPRPAPAAPANDPFDGSRYEGDEHILVPRAYLENVYRNTDISRKHWRKEAERSERKRESRLAMR